MLEEKIYMHPSGDKSRVVVRIYDDLEALSMAAAQIFLETACKEEKEKGLFTVLLSGGKTPKRLYEILATSDYRERVPWGKTHLFWGDERCVNVSHPESNYFLVNESLLSAVEIPPENIYPMPGELKDGAAFLYEEEVRSFFSIHQKRHVDIPGFDLVLLGLGTDGHILSLFPSSSALGAMSRILLDVYVEEEEIPHRVTMTIPVINKASKVIFLVSGASKCEILNATLTGDYDPRRYPAHGLKPDAGEVIYLVDREAASDLD